MIKKLYHQANSLWDQNRSTLAPGINFTTKVVKSFSELGKIIDPKISNYVQLGFEVRTHYNEVFGQNSNYFLRDGWKVFGFQELNLLITQVTTNYFKDKLENINKVGGINNSDFIVHLDSENKYGWNGTLDHIESCHYTGNLNKIHSLIAEKIWEDRNYLCISSFKKGWYDYFTIDAENLHDNYIVGGNTKKYHQYVEGFRKKGLGRSIIFYGVPGSGKSSIVKGLSHLLGMRALRINQLSSIRNSALVELINIFNPDAILLEDIDHLYSYDLSTLLEKIESFNAANKFIFATANEVGKINDALLRPGRFDELVEITKDEESLRQEIDDPEVYEAVKDYPIAFVMEVKKRISISGKEAVLNGGMDDIVKRIEKMSKENYKL